jgi:hypothetical protein
LRFVPHHKPSATILSEIAPLLDKWVDGRKSVFNIEKLEPFGVDLITNDGFKYSIDHARIVVSFKHRLKAKHVSGGLPTLEMMSRAAAYTNLFPDVSSRVTEVMSLLETQKRPLLEVGIISTTHVAEEDAPPGVRRLIEYVSKPWNATEEFTINIASKLTETAGWSDHCIHQLVRTDDAEDLLSLNFDWQRRFSEARVMTDKALELTLTACQESALKYFEDLAEGNRFDEHINKHEQ